MAESMFGRAAKWVATKVAPVAANVGMAVAGSAAPPGISHGPEDYLAVSGYQKTQERKDQAKRKTQSGNDKDGDNDQPINLPSIPVKRMRRR